MAFERFKHRYGHGRTITVGATGSFSITACLATELGVDGGRLAVFYFDEDTKRVAIEFLNEGDKDSAAKAYAAKAVCYRHKDRNKQPGTLVLAGKAFLNYYHIKFPQRRIPATIEEVDGKKMIVFKVEVEADDE